MADFRINPETGEYEYIGNAYGSEEEVTPEAAPAPAKTSLFETQPKQVGLEEQQALDATQEVKAREVVEQDGEDRPVFSADPGVIARDIGRNIANPIAAIGTDYVDLGHGIADIAVQTGEWLQGRGFDASKIFDDSDNPWTEARINAMRSETQAGQFLNTTSRVVVALATLPKVALKWGVVAPLKALSKAPGIGKLAKGGAASLTKLDDAMKAPRAITAGSTKALNAIQKGAPASKAAKLANADDWLKLTYKDVVNAGVEGGRAATLMRSTERAAKSLTKGKASLRTIGEALAWDTFVAFNMAGEGNPMLDETFTDMAADMGWFYIPQLETSIRDTGLEAKFKQMGDGLIVGGILNSVFDVMRIYRFSRAFQKADAGEKNLIIKALNEEGENLGGSVARLAEQADAIAMLPSRAASLSRGADEVLESGGVDEVLESGFDPGAPLGPGLLERELDRVEQVRANNQLTEEMQAAALKEQQLRVDADAAALEAEAAAGVSDLVPSPSGQLAPEGGPIEAVDVQVIRPPEPTITPQTMRAGFQEYVQRRFGEQNPDFAAELIDTTKRLMPRNRVDAIDFLEQFPLRYNGIGMMEASDSIANNFMIQRGLEEGWMTVDSDMLLMYNRKLAFDFDRNEYAIKQASALDEAAEIERYNAKLAEQGTDPATGPVQDQLAKMEVRDEFDESAIGKSTAGETREVDQVLETANPDQALVEAKRQERLAAVQDAGAKNAEQAQIDIDAIAAYDDIGSDRQVVAEMLNLDLDNLPKYEIEKIGNRRYQVLDELGESVDGNTYSTLKGARKGLEIASKKQADSYVAKARTMADRAVDKPVQKEYGISISDSPLVRGSLKLTQRQSELLNELGIPIEGVELDLSQNDLAGMSNSIKQLMEESTGSQRRVLGNILNRVDEKVIELGPAARLAAEVDKTIALSQKFLKDGEICF